MNAQNGLKIFKGFTGFEEFRNLYASLNIVNVIK